jgi:hypothetical protein
MISDIEFQRKFCVGQVDDLLRKLEGVDHAPLKDAMYEVLFDLRNSLNVPNTNAKRAEEIQENNKKVTKAIIKEFRELENDKKSGHHLEGELSSRFNELKELFFGSAKKLTEHVGAYVVNILSPEQAHKR